MTRRPSRLPTEVALAAFAVAISVGFAAWVRHRHLADCPGFAEDGRGLCGWCWCPGGAYDGSDYLHDFTF